MSEFIVQTLAGKVRGYLRRGFGNFQFYAFKGIPYAKPPVGKLRFRDPEPAKTWIGVREATRHGSRCPQMDIFSRKILGNDDCLYLNVYARHINKTLRWPVMVNIHAGGFMYLHGDDSVYGPDHFMRKDVVFVTFNYRVGVFGFLNVDNEQASGNQGLKDQVMALEWVRNNIANFGGDPENVTIFGTSAGGASVHYLAMSPSTNGLFHKVILQSGVALHPWALHSDSEEQAHRLSEFLGHRKKDSTSVVEFLRTIDAHKLVETQEKIQAQHPGIRFILPFGPSIDCNSKKPFIPASPTIAAAKGIQLPMIIGHNSREGIFFIREARKVLEVFDKKIDQLLNPNTIVTMKKLYNLTPEQLKCIYFNNEYITEKNFEKLIDFVGDLYFAEATHRVVRIQVEKSCAPTYFYQYSYYDKRTTKRLVNRTHLSGASHADDLSNLFKAQIFDERFGVLENNYDKYRIAKQMVEMWVNFATTGVPTPNQSDLIPLYWQPVDNKKSFPYLDICENLHMDRMLNLEERYKAHGLSERKL